MLILPRRWAGQPAGPTRPNVELLGPDAILWSATARELLHIGVGPLVRSSEGSFAGYGSTPQGLGAKWSNVANAGVSFGTVQPLTSNTGVTILAVAAPVAAARIKTALSQRRGAGSFEQYSLYFDSNAVVTGTSGDICLYSRTTSGSVASVHARAADGITIDGALHCWVLSNSTSSGYIYQDGTAIAPFTSTALSGTFISTTQKTQVGNLADSSATNYGDDDPLLLVVAWPRQIPAAQAQYLSALLARGIGPAFAPVRRVWVPSSAAGGNTPINPGVGSLSLTGYAPSISQPIGVAPDVGALTLTGYAPTISQTLVVSPGVGSLALTGYAPTVARTDNQAVTPGVGALAITGYAPSISQPIGVAPAVGALTLTGYAPSVAQSVAGTVQPDVGLLTLTGYAPVVARTDHQAVEPAAGALTLTGYAPTVAQPLNVSPGDGAVTLTGHAPAVSQTAGQIIAADVGQIVLTGYAPTVARTTVGDAPAVFTADSRLLVGPAVLPGVRQAVGPAVLPGVRQAVTTFKPPAGRIGPGTL